MDKLPPLSFSALNNYRTCPAQFEAMRVSKRYPFTDTDATIWGKEVHEALEKYVRDGKPLPDRMKQFQQYADSLVCRECDIYVEIKLGVLEDLTPCDFFDPDCWARCIVDYLRINGSIALNLDHKTGKRREGSDQLKMSSGIIFANFPQVSDIVCGYAWLKEGGKISRSKYNRNDVPKIWQSFERTISEMKWSYSTGSWPRKPSGLCKKWCAVVDCPYNGFYRG